MAGGEGGIEGFEVGVVVGADAEFVVFDVVGGPGGEVRIGFGVSSRPRQTQSSDCDRNAEPERARGQACGKWGLGKWRLVCKK